MDEAKVYIRYFVERRRISGVLGQAFLLVPKAVEGLMSMATIKKDEWFATPVGVDDFDRRYIRKGYGIELPPPIEIAGDWFEVECGMIVICHSPLGATDIPEPIYLMDSK